MEITTLKCDIKSENETDIKCSGAIKHFRVPVMFDHDQEDGKSKTQPYFEMKELDLCENHFNFMTKNRKIIYAYGCMGYNDYFLHCEHKYNDDFDKIVCEKCGNIKIK